MRRSFAVLLALLIWASLSMLSSRQATAADELIPFITPPAGGGAYIVGAGMISVSNKYIAQPKFVHEAATGTMDIVRRMMAREAAKKGVFGIFGTVDAWNAYKGNNEYKGRPFTGLRMVVFVMGTDLYLVVPSNSPIKSYGDDGVAKKDYKPYYYTYKETVEGIQNGSLDGGFIAGGYPIAAYNELAVQKAVRIVPVDEGKVKKIVAEHPYYYRTTVKAKSYKGLEQDTTIMGFTTGLWTHAGLSDDIVYKFLKNLFDHRNDYYAIHSTAKELTPQSALNGLSVPLHPGAEKYFREVGILKK
ncbi:MAG: TAXI family TRAP transporter solute-binding subunit [Syntrophorhabdales bacterium]